MTDKGITEPSAKVDRRLRKNREAPTGGRPRKEIDWDVVDELLVSGCIGTEVAAFFGMHPETLYRRVEDRYKVAFSVYLQEKQSLGDAMVRKKQYLKALGIDKDGDNMMLIWLGKNRLKQSDTPVQDNINEKAFEKFEKVMGQLDSLQSAKSKPEGA